MYVHGQVYAAGAASPLPGANDNRAWSLAVGQAIESIQPFAAGVRALAGKPTPWSAEDMRGLAALLPANFLGDRVKTAMYLRWPELGKPAAAHSTGWWPVYVDAYGAPCQCPWCSNY